MSKWSCVILAALCLGCDESAPLASAPTTLPQTVAGNGVIAGSVRFVGEAPKMRTFIANEPCCSGDPPIVEETVVVNSNGTLANVMLWLENAPRTDGSAKVPAVLDQVRCRYVPHVQAMQVGQTLRVRSSDPTMHNVHYVPDHNRARNLSMTDAGVEVPVKFDFPEIIRMKCDVHPWMTAWVGVFDHPFFAVTSEQGAFEIRGVPTGSYKLIAWHEMYGQQERMITFTDDKPIEMDFSFGRSS
jgi:hypothetical protein